MRSLAWADTGYSAHGVHAARVAVARTGTGRRTTGVYRVYSAKKILGNWMNVRVPPETRGTPDSVGIGSSSEPSVNGVR